MLKRNNRFSRKNFEFFRKKMKAFRSGGFLFLYGDFNPPQKFAVVISKKTEKSAIKRWRFRRQVYSFFQTHQESLPERFHLICLYKAPKIPAEDSDLYADLQKFLTFAKNLKK